MSFRAHGNLRVRSSLAFSNTKQTDTAPTTLQQIEIAVDKASGEHHPTAQISVDDSSDIRTGDQVS
jgi:hypothetical protein